MEPNTLQEQNEDLNLDDFERQKKALELKKLAIELEKAEAEKEKVQIEVGRLKKPWFWQQITFETIGKIILGAGVMAFSYGIFIQPYFTLKEAKLQTQIDSSSNLNKQLSDEKAYLQNMNQKIDSVNQVSIAELQERKKAIDSLEGVAIKMNNDIESLSKITENTKRIQLAISKCRSNMAKTPNVTRYLKTFASKLPKTDTLLILPDKKIGTEAFRKDLEIGLLELKVLSKNIFGKTDLIDEFITQETNRFSYSGLGFGNVDRLPLSVLVSPTIAKNGKRYSFYTGEYTYEVNADGFSAEAEVFDKENLSSTTRQFFDNQIFFEGRAHYVLQLPFFRLEQELIKKLHNQRR